MDYTGSARRATAVTDQTGVKMECGWNRQRRPGVFYVGKKPAYKKRS